MKALALSAALIVSGCAKEDLPELRETPDAEQGGTELVAALNANGNVSLYLPDMYPAPLTEIPAVKLNGSAEQMLGAVEVALKNVDPDAAAASMVWSYIGELVFNMLILVGTVKMADRVVREMMGL